MICADVGLPIGFIPPGVPEHNGVVESAIWRDNKTGKAAGRYAEGLAWDLRVFPGSRGSTVVVELFTEKKGGRSGSCRCSSGGACRTAAR